MKFKDYKELKLDNLNSIFIYIFILYPILILF